MARSESKQPIILELAAIPLLMRPDWAEADREWVPFFHQQETPLRFISMHVPFDLDEPIARIKRLTRPLNRWAQLFAPLVQAIDAWALSGQRPNLDGLLGALPDDLRADILRILPTASAATLDQWTWTIDRLGEPLWQRGPLLDYGDWYETLQQRAPLRGIRHFVLAWPKIHTQAAVNELATAVQHAFRTTCWEAELPSIFSGKYHEGRPFLTPEESHHPHVAILTGYDIRGTWASGDVLHTLFQLGIDLASVVDVLPVKRTQAEMKSSWHATADRARQERGDAGDVKSRRRGEAARQAQEALESGQAFHETQIHLAVSAADTEALQQAVRTIKLSAGNQLPLLHASGVQAALAQFWTPTETRRIDGGPARRSRTVLSHGVASLLPVGLRLPNRTDGMLWMMQDTTPIFFDPFSDNSPGHMVMVGATGSGKTVTLNVWLRRMLSMGTRVIVMEPQGHSKRLVATVGDGGQHFPLTLNDTLNPLDIVVYRDVDGTPPNLSTQIEHVMAQFSVLFGDDDYVSVNGANKKTFRPASWSSDQRALLRIALERVYAPLDLETVTTAETPIISDVVAALERLAADLASGANGMPADTYQAETAARLASSFRLTFIIGSYGRTVNQRTSIDWSLTKPLTAYGLDGLPAGLWRTYYFGQIFGAVNRYIRRPGRDRSHPTIVVFDEFAFSLNRIPTLAEFAAEATKTWRTFKAAFWAADQDLHRYLGTGENDQNPDLLSVWQNSPIKMIMLQEPQPAGRLKHLVDGVHEGHIKYVTTLAKGNGLLIWKASDGAHNEMFQGYVDMTTEEQQAFFGS